MKTSPTRVPIVRDHDTLRGSEVEFIIQHLLWLVYAVISTPLSSIFKMTTVQEKTCFITMINSWAGQIKL